MCSVTGFEVGPKTSAFPYSDCMEEGIVIVSLTILFLLKYQPCELQFERDCSLENIWSFVLELHRKGLIVHNGEHTY